MIKFSRPKATLVVTDETRLNLMERQADELRAANAELESFTYSVSHDLRAPIRAIVGFTQALSEDYGDRLDDEGRRLLGIVQHEAIRMGTLIDDLLAFSQLGRAPLSCSPIDMGRLVREVVGDLDAQRGGAEIDVEELPPTSGDRALIRQVLTNLLSNALKYSSKTARPRIVVSGDSDGAFATYSVADNGVGFDMQYADRLFGVFQRLHRNDEFEGTGVGLAIVARIVHRHGGMVDAAGAPGDGATFSFALPVRGVR